MRTGDEPVWGGLRACAPAQPHVRGVAGRKLSRRKTCAVPSTLLHVFWPSGNGRQIVPADTGQVARASEKPLALRHGECHGCICQANASGELAVRSIAGSSVDQDCTLSWKVAEEPLNCAD